MICSSPEEAERAADALIGRKLVTRQSGTEGLVVPAVLLTEKVDIDIELYLDLAIDTARAEVVIIASPPPVSKYGSLQWPVSLASAYHSMAV